MESMKSTRTAIGVVFVFCCISASIWQLNAQEDVVIAPEEDVGNEIPDKCLCHDVCIGAPGRDGQNGQPGFNGSDGAPGPPGPPGAVSVGPPGEEGQKGDRGERGERGDRGAKGERGSAGSMGTKGAKGERGEPGNQGSQISKIAVKYVGGTCTARNKGEIYMNPRNSHLVVCDGSNWKYVKLTSIVAPTIASSCKEYYDRGFRGSQHSKAYLLRGTGWSNYKTYCDMTSGGWTLVGRACGSTTEFAPKSTFWYSNALINPNTAENIRDLRSMKNRGWISIPGRKVKVCFKGPQTSCAVFSHNLGLSLSRLFASKFGVTVSENYNFQKLRSAFHIPPNLTYKANKQWCGLNLGNGCNHGTNPNVGYRHTISRIGCIGDNSGHSMCRLDDYALGIGVSSCKDGHGCYRTGTRTKSLHYKDAGRFGYFRQTAFIYVQ